MWQRFRAQWRVRLEKSVLQEIIAIFTASYVLAGSISRSEIAEAVQLYADGYGDVGHLYKTLGFGSREEAVQALDQSIRFYVNSPSSEWPKALLDRLAVTRLPENRMAARLLVGSVVFTRNARRMVDVIRMQS